MGSVHAPGFSPHRCTPWHVFKAEDHPADLRVSLELFRGVSVRKASFSRAGTRTVLGTQALCVTHRWAASGWGSGGFTEDLGFQWPPGIRGAEGANLHSVSFQDLRGRVTGCGGANQAGAGRL